MNTDNASYRSRMSLRLGSALLALIESGQLAGRTLPSRLDTLASRYQAMIDGAAPQLKAGQWASIARIAGTLDLSHPAAHISMQALLRADKSDHRLSFMAEGMKPHEIYAIISIVERLNASGVDLKDEPAVQAWLEGQGVQVAKPA